MAELELVWVKECEVCGREHRQMDHVCIDSIEEVDGATGRFYERCERWYSNHIEHIQAQHLVSAATAARA